MEDQKLTVTDALNVVFVTYNAHEAGGQQKELSRI
jgi:hypothetical protein